MVLLTSGPTFRVGLSITMTSSLLPPAVKSILMIKRSSDVGAFSGPVLALIARSSRALSILWRGETSSPAFKILPSTSGAVEKICCARSRAQVPLTIRARLRASMASTSSSSLPNPSHTSSGSRYFLRIAASLVRPLEADEGGWSREQLEAMDTAFCCALERAIASGQERRASACAEFAGARTGSAVLARARAAAWYRSAAGALPGGRSSMFFV